MRSAGEWGVYVVRTWRVCGGEEKGAVLPHASWVVVVQCANRTDRHLEKKIVLSYINSKYIYYTINDSRSRVDEILFIPGRILVSYLVSNRTSSLFYPSLIPSNCPPNLLFSLFTIICQVERYHTRIIPVFGFVFCLGCWCVLYMYDAAVVVVPSTMSAWHALMSTLSSLWCNPKYKKKQYE